MRLRKFILLFCFGVQCLNIYSQKPNLDFAFGSGNSSVFHKGNCITQDTSGNIFVTGTFYGSVDFDPSPSTATLISNGINYQDVFLAKYNKNGQYIWAFNFGAAFKDDVGKSVTTDNAGNVFVVGQIDGVVDFDPSPSTFTLSGLKQIFLAKYNTNGVFQWAFIINSGSSASIPTKVISDYFGNIYLTGQFGATTDFDPSPTIKNLISVGSLDVFIAKYTNNGNYLWAFNVGSINSEISNGMCLDRFGHIYITGMFSGGTLDFDPGPGVANVTSFAGDDIFVAKYDTSGNYKWAFGLGPGSTESGNSLTSDKQGNVFVTGTFMNTVDFNPSTSSNANLTSSGVRDIFVAKYDSLGIYNWAFKVGSTDNDESFSIQNDSTGNIYVGGYFRQTCDFDPSVSTYSISSIGLSDFFIAQYNNTGNFVWAFNGGGINHDMCNSISYTKDGNILATGYYTGLQGAFDPWSTTSTILGFGSENILVAKYSPCINIPPNPINTSLNTSICSGLTATLNATGIGALNWYSSLTSTIVLATGSSFITPILTTTSVASTYTFFVEASTCSVSINRTPITITVNPLPIVTAGTSTFCSGTSGCLYGGGAITYTWVGPCAFVMNVQNPCFVYSGSCGCTFTCMGTDANGCSNTATVCMTILPNPSVTVSTSNTLICIGQTSSLTAGGALTYSWSTSASGSVVAVSPTITTNYTVTGTDGNGCTNNSIITQSVSACIGINEIIYNSDIQLYPNPTSGELILRTAPKENLELEVYNAIGEMVLKQIIIKAETNIDLKEKANGVYFIKIIENGKSIYYSKIIKQ